MIKAIFGKIILNQHSCPMCGNNTLNTSEDFICDVCGYSSIDKEATQYKIIVPPPGIRKSPPRHIQKELLEIQDNKCYWCGNPFGMVYWKNNKILYLKIHWDHKTPFSFTQTNKEDNWVASCNVCNLFKHNFLFKSEKKCRDFILRKWEQAINYGKIEFE